MAVDAGSTDYAPSTNEAAHSEGALESTFASIAVFFETWDWDAKPLVFEPMEGELPPSLDDLGRAVCAVVQEWREIRNRRMA